MTTTTVSAIFKDARQSTAHIVTRYTGYFNGLVVGGIRHHGQINIARVTDYGGPWVVTIYILVTAPNRGVATSFQHRAIVFDEALAEVEHLVQNWAAALEVAA